MTSRVIFGIGGGPAIRSGVMTGTVGIAVLAGALLNNPVIGGRSAPSAPPVQEE
ncbi:hypothetical protein [Paracoccus sp. SCSIO 75233]|uniref:hypothetical protein n=1 Tax=Paracoccus sp. SCSIO 75233 TaxID=3017782 RepID=UPI0022F00881|nr:hypothetical protein [Paracoccus sp. SCSIO 75233]WBU53605.1 hypothetical protein PAF12_01835 [Paracoccus sp. SCSIO 75233]